MRGFGLRSGRVPRPFKVTIILLAQSSQALSMGAISLFLPLIRTDIGISFSQAGVLAGVATFCYAVMQLPAGILADRFGARRLFIIGLLGVNLLSISFSIIHSYDALLVNQALSGIFRSLVFAPGMILMSALFSGERRATASGIFVAGGVSSSVLLNLLGPLFVGDIGWRWLIFIFAAGGILVTLFYAALPEPSLAKGAKVPLRQLPHLFRTSTIWWAGGIQFVRMSIVNALFFWLPSLLVIDKGLSVQAAGVIVATSAAITAPSNILGGYISDRMKHPTRLISFSLCMMALTISGLSITRDTSIIFILVAVNAMFVQLYFGPIFSLPVRAYGVQYGGVLSGFGNLCANLGGFTFDIVLGVVKERTGSFSPALVALTALCFLGTFFSVMLGRAIEKATRVNRSVPSDSAGSVMPDGKLT